MVNFYPKVITRNQLEPLSSIGLITGANLWTEESNFEEG